jgi:hypothetical protein
MGHTIRRIILESIASMGEGLGGGNEHQGYLLRRIMVDWQLKGIRSSVPGSLAADKKRSPP